MKRKCIGLFVAAFVLTQTMSAFAAGSVSTRPSGGGGSSSSGKTESLTTGKLDQGQAPAISTGGTTVAGGNVSISADATVLANAGFSQATIDKINIINSGIEPLYRTIGTTNMVGYVALAPVQTAVAAGETSVTLTVPNLVQGLNDVQILYYNSTTKAWELMAPTAIDYATKQISVNLSGTTPFTIVYKK